LLVFPLERKEGGREGGREDLPMDMQRVTTGTRPSGMMETARAMA
jgi:hypothetical protein